MPDILSQGEDREPSPWPRRLAMTVIVIGVAIAGVVYLALPRHQHAPAALPTPAVTGHPAPATASLAPVSVSLDAPGLRGEPDGIGGPTVPWDDSVRIPVTGTRPAWFSPATGRSEPIGGLPAGSSGYQFTRLDGGWVVQANATPVDSVNAAWGNAVNTASAAKSVCGGCAGPSLPVWFLADGARSATPIGTADQVAPAAAAGAVWLTSYPPSADPGSAAGTAREVSLAGTPLQPPVRLPPGYQIDQGTDRGLLLAPASPRPGTPADKLWNPAAPRASRTFDSVLAAGPTEIASASRCAPTCQVQVLDLTTGRQTVVRLPGGSSAAGGAFSPSGEFLALQLSSSNNGDDGALAMRLEVAAVASGRLAAVPGTFVSSDALVGFGWPTHGDSLVAEFIFATKTQLTSWNPGAARLAVTVIAPGPSQASLIVG